MEFTIFEKILIFTLLVVFAIILENYIGSRIKSKSKGKNDNPSFDNSIKESDPEESIKANQPMILNHENLVIEDKEENPFQFNKEEALDPFDQYEIDNEIYETPESENKKEGISIEEKLKMYGKKIPGIEDDIGNILNNDDF